MATASEAWFKLINPESCWSTVSLEGIEYVDHLKKAIKKKVAPKLDNYSIIYLTIKATYDDKDPENAVELDPRDDLKKVLERVGRQDSPVAKNIRFFVFLPLTSQPIKLRCIFKYGKDVRNVAYEIHKSKISLSSFVEKAKSLFMFPKGIEDSDITIELQDRKDPKQTIRLLVDSNSILQSEAEIGTMTLVVSTLQRPFSSWTFNEFKDQFGIIADSYGDLDTFELDMEDFSGNAEVEKLFEDMLTETTKLQFICPTVHKGKESSRSLFIYEVLKQAIYASASGFTSASASTSASTAILQLQVQKEVAGGLGRGPADYVIEYSDRLIMVIEAKRRDFDQGIAQCAVQLDCAGNLNRKRKWEDPLLPKTLFGFVTTGDLSVLLRLESKPTGETIVNVHREAPLHISNLKNKSKTREELSQLFRYLLTVFKAMEGNDIPAKRTRTG
ncbi:hypothetical protein BDZ91DRAFT_711004 [Kalaharituber pfeilii]|nr:hypothetical protein BDZ91DRAFT_711004 [Kalaharituber pfeilii]